MNIFAVAETGARIPVSTALMKLPQGSKTITQIAEEIKTSLGEAWLPRIYTERILQMRTRSHSLNQSSTKTTSVEIQHTLLGVELKIGRRRLSCPDLATARYLAVFARAAIPAVAVPYDISRISQLADELESSWQRMLLLIERAASGRAQSFHSRLRNLLIGEVRQQITEAGAGTLVPEFNQNTKQRRPLKS